MPYFPVAPRSRGFRRGFRRRRRKWQWVRQTGNNTVSVAPPNVSFQDLLLDWKNQFGFTVNLPEITIWRVRFKISIRITYPAAIATAEADGVNVAVFVNDVDIVNSYPNPISAPYSQQFMMYDTLYSSEQAVMGGIVPVASGTGFMYREYDIKARRRINNIKHSLIVGVAPSGGLATLAGFAWQTSILLAIGR